MKDFVEVGDCFINVGDILNELNNKCPRSNCSIDTHNFDIFTYDNGVTVTFLVKDRPAGNNQSPAGDFEVDVDISTDGRARFKINRYLDKNRLIKTLLSDIGLDYLDESEIKDIEKRASEYIATHTNEDKWSYELKLAEDEYSDKIIERHKYFMEHEDGFKHIYNFSIDPKDYICDVNEIKANIKNELSSFPEISCDNDIEYDYDNQNHLYITFSLCFNDNERLFLYYYPEWKTYNYYVVDSNIEGESFRSVNSILNSIYNQISRFYTLYELYEEYDGDFVSFYVYIRDTINKNEADSVKDILHKAIDNGKISQEDKDELGIEREDNVVRAIWESMCDQDFISEKQQKYVELAKRSLQ